MAKALRLDVSNPPEKPTFSDVQANHYSYVYVEAVFSAGLLSGNGAGKFGLSTLTDAGSIASWTKGSVAVAQQSKTPSASMDAGVALRR